MPKFREGDLVVAKILKEPYHSLTHDKWSYVNAMIEIMNKQTVMTVNWVEESGGLVSTDLYNYHQDDLELFTIDLENK